MTSARSMLVAALTVLAWLAVQACAHDLVGGDGAGGGLARSLLLPCLVLFVALAALLLWLRSRSGVAPGSTRFLAVGAAMVAVGTWAAVRVLFAAPLATVWAPVARATLALQGIVLLAVAWRGLPSGTLLTLIGTVMGVTTLAPVAVLKPTLARRAAALEQVRAARAAEDAASHRYTPR